MSTAQSFLFFLIVMGAAATMLRLVSRTTPTVPYPVLLAIGGIVIRFGAAYAALCPLRWPYPWPLIRASARRSR
jgi:hypothetical protein